MPSVDSNVAAPVVGRRRGQVDGRRGGQRVAGGEHGDPTVDRLGGDLRRAAELAGPALDAHEVARCEIGAAAPAEHEHALRRRRVAVGVAVLLLDEEPVGHVLERQLGGDDRLDGDVLAGDRASRRPNPGPPRPG